MAFNSGYISNKQNFRSQIDAVLDLLMSGETLTHLTAHHLTGTISLQYHVFQLRKEGYPVITKMKTAADGRRYAEYHMDLESQKNMHMCNLMGCS